MKKTVVIANLIDWSESFVDENGSFYCGTAEQEKRNAAKIVGLSDLVIETTDLHPITAPEHKINGGLYPVHNAVLPEKYGKDFVYLVASDGRKLTLEDKTLSPRLTRTIRDSLRNRKTGIIVPREVYFQGKEGEEGLPFCYPNDIEQTFQAKILGPLDVANPLSSYNHVIAPKRYFDATRLESNLALQFPDNQELITNLIGIPDINYNIFTLLRLRYPLKKYNLVFVNTGVVEGICRLHTSIGQKQMFPFDRIINIADASTPLHGIGLGYETPEQSREACMRVCKDIGIEYMTTKQALKEFHRRII